MTEPSDLPAANPPDRPMGESGTDGGEPDAEGSERGEPAARRVGRRVASAIGGAADYVESAASAVGHAVEATARRFDERPGARVRRVRRLGRIPLPYLYDVDPDARGRTPRELGVGRIAAGAIAGTAAGGARNRGPAFLPWKPSRSLTWTARCNPLGLPAARLASL